jgi:error-prone DNA polymerase
MPDLPPGKRRPVVEPPPAGQPLAGPPYAELRAKTNFSFLQGASHPDELVQRAAELGYSALAITDASSLAGVVRAHVAAKEVGLKLLIGAEVSPCDGPTAVLLATDRAAYGRLSRLLTLGRRAAPKGQCLLSVDDLARHAQGLIALVEFERERWPGQRPGKSDPPLASSDPAASTSQPPGRPCAAISKLASVFPDRCYLLAELHYGPDDAARLARLAAASAALGIPLVASGDVHYHDPGRCALHDVLTAIRHNVTVSQARPHLFANAQRHLRSREEIGRRFAALPQAVARTLEIAARCTFSLDELRYEYPEELCPPGRSPTQYLHELTWSGAAQRYPGGVPEKVRRLLEHELALIAELRYEAYFLTVWDLVRFARQRGILCQGRGSAANSAVCYCLGVTAVDPERMDVLFERFISRERNEAPDIDVDFEHERREEVLQYLYEKYGRERAGITAEVITYRPRSAVRDVGKALGLPAEKIDSLAKSLDHSYGVHAGDESRLAQRCREGGLDPASPGGRRLIYLVGELLGFPRHLSQHVGGMVMTQGPLCELVPIENAAMPGRTVVQWDKDDLDALGILKVDCLALGMLTAIRKCFDLVKQHTGRELTLANIPPEDPAVYDMICQADTLGVFQIESRAQMSMLPRLRPRCFYDLVIEVAIVRPGPIQGDMVHPYLRRRAGLEPVEYPNEALRQVLHKTLGVPLFQEQAMRLAVVAAGFTPGEADQLRRAMGAWRRPGVIDQFRQKLIDGMLARGLTAEFAQRVFEQIRGFGEYGFPESHAASFALLVYVSAWLKRHYPAAFTCAVLNSQPMGFYAPAQLVRDAQQHHVEVLPCDVNFSQWDHTLANTAGRPACPPRADGQCHGPSSADPAEHDPRPAGDSPRLAIRLGFRIITGLPQLPIKALEAARGRGRFTSFADLVCRTRLTKVVLQKLAVGDVFGSLGLSRRQALWQALAIDRRDRPLFADDDEPLPAALPRMSPFEQVLADYYASGLSLKAHPMSFLRDRLKKRNVAAAVDLQEIAHDRRLAVAGLVLVRQRPSTAKGITFVTLEDETGQANLIIHQQTWDKYHRPASLAGVLLARGRLERQQGVTHVIVEQLEDLGPWIGQLRATSRDFR